MIVLVARTADETAQSTVPFGARSGHFDEDIVRP